MIRTHSKVNTIRQLSNEDKRDTVQFITMQNVKQRLSQRINIYLQPQHDRMIFILALVT
jgi:hypothetical protein